MIFMAPRVQLQDLSLEHYRTYLITSRQKCYQLVFYAE